MKVDPNQLYFDERFARPITPAPNLHEPVLWFKNLHLVRQVGVRNDDRNCIRSFKFRPGLNILWAEPEDPELTAGLYGDGIAGHSTGKTLFCRILRHLLGEPNYGTKELEEHVRGTFQELWAVATVRLNSKTWIIGRALTGPGSDFAIENGDVETVFQTVPSSAEYRKFTDALETVCGKPLAGIHASEAWRNLLPWIARDQEARFSTVTAWRDSSSEADNPRTSAAAQHLILRAVLGLLDPTEFDIRQEILLKDEDIKRWSIDLPLKQTVAARDLAQVARTLRSIPRCNVELVDLEAAKTYVTKQREIREEGIGHFRAQPEAQEVQDARKNLQDAISTNATATARIRTLDQEIPTLETQASNSLLTVNKIKNGGLRDTKRVTDGYCPNGFLTAQKRGCVPKSPDDVDHSMAEISDLEKQAKSLADTVQSRRDEKARLESQADQLSEEIAARQRALNQAIRTYPSPSAVIEKEITLLEKTENELVDAIRSADEARKLLSSVANAQGRIVELKEKLEQLTDAANQRLKKFSDIFGDISKALLGTQISAWTDLGDRGFHLHMKRSRELGGAAVESVKTIAFDLAAVLHSVEGNCAHPRFLIHDGPREADMARVIYERFFLYSRRMESAFAENCATFQYILTTTTHPPSDMREGSKWLLGEKLSGKTKAGRLLKEEF